MMRAGALGGAMFGAYRQRIPQRTQPSRWSFLQGRMGGGGMALPPGVRVPMGNDVRRPPQPGGLMAPTGGPQTVQPQPGGPPQAPSQPGMAGILGGAMSAAPAMPAPTPPAGPAAPGMGVPPGMPPPDVGAPRPPTGGPLMGAMLGATASPQDYLRRAGYGMGAQPGYGSRA